MPTTVIVVGAGLSGLSLAKTYLQVDPSIKLIVLEALPTLGGTWAASRIYPTLHVQSPIGVYEYADRSLVPEVPLHKDGWIPAKEMHRYLCEFAEEFGIADKIRFNTEVRLAERHGDGKQWQVLLEEKGKEMEVLVCDKLIVTTGLTSKPRMPNIDVSKFTSPCFHSKELGLQHEYLVGPKVERVTVVGGGKSAVDAVNMCLASGKIVDWLIRPPKPGVGNGFIPITPGVVHGRNVFTFALFRWASHMYPSLSDTSSWSYYFFHSGKSKIGMWLHEAYWNYLSRGMWDNVGYDKNENMKRLEPMIKDKPQYWLHSGANVLTHPEILDWIRQGDEGPLKLHIANITSTAGDTVSLDTGKVLQSDALILCTGFYNAPTIFSEADCKYIGIPHTPTEGDHKDWDFIDKAADAEVLRLFPGLLKAPKVTVAHPNRTPYRLFRQIIPLPFLENEDRSLVFGGIESAALYGLHAQPASLWTVAWLTGKLDLSKVSDGKTVVGPEGAPNAKWEVAKRVAFVKRRYLYFGWAGSSALYDYIPIVDNICRELGVRVRRNSEGFWGDLFSRYMPESYRGIVQEWMKIQEGKKGKELEK